MTHVAGNRVAVIWAIARADFLERVRRYSFIFTLGFALYLGYLTISGNLVLQVGRVRGIFNSAWVGALLSLVASAFISLAGFYFVKNTIQRDRETRVGQILAATPLSKFIYVLGKVISNLTVLTLMIAVLALSGIAMQSGTGKPFEILYTLLWYVGPMHGMAELDFMGSAPGTASTHSLRCMWP